MKLQRATSWMTGAILLMALLAVAVVLLGCGAEAAKSGGPLVGQFPTVANLSKKVVHVRSTMRYFADAPWTSQDDLWIDGNTGRYRKEERKNDNLTGVEAFDGQTFRRYETGSHSAVSWSKELLSSVEPHKCNFYATGMVDIRYSDSPNENKVAPTKYISLVESVPSKLDPETRKNTDNGDTKVGSLTTKWGTGTLYRIITPKDLTLELTIEGVRVSIMYAPRGTSDYLVRIANSLTKVAG